MTEILRMRVIGAILLTYSAIAMVLGLLWLPSPQALQDIQTTARHLDDPAPSLSCDDISRAIPMLKRLSNGSISASDDGELEVVSDIWDQLPAAQQNALINLIRKGQECSSDDRGYVVVRDVISRNIIFRQPSIAIHD